MHRGGRINSHKPEWDSSILKSCPRDRPLASFHIILALLSYSWLPAVSTWGLPLCPWWQASTRLSPGHPNNGKALGRNGLRGGTWEKLDWLLHFPKAPGTQVLPPASSFLSREAGWPLKSLRRRCEPHSCPMELFRQAWHSQPYGNS